jgi:O-antigen ligase
MTTTSSPRVLIATKVLRVGLIAVILATIVPYGAVSPSWFYGAAFMNGLVFAATLAIPFRNMELLRVYRTALVVMVLLVGYLVLQTVYLPRGAFAHSIWGTVRGPLGLDGGTISVNPAGTLASIPLIVHPFLIFMGTLVLHQSNDAAVGFFRQLSFIGAGIAAFGLVQHLLFPNKLLLGPKLYYVDSVTGTFVNRNSAATLFGVAALLLAAMVVRQLDELRAHDPLDQGEPNDRQKQQRMLLGLVALFALVLLAEFLTHSRGGLLATFPPLILLAAWFGYSLLPAGASRAMRVGLAVGTVALFGLLFSVFGARSLLRLEQGGAEDNRWCIYQSTLAAIRDNPWLGTGFGTFDQVFPVYRNPECGIFGLWDRAHNSFLEGYLGMGLPFAIALVFVLGYLISVFMTGYRARRRYRIIPLVGLATLLLILLHSAVDFSLQIPGVSAYVAAALGAAVAISLARKRSGREVVIEPE